MTEKRKRGQNFTFEEKEKLVNLVQKYKDIVLNKKTDGETNRAKVLAWSKIVSQYNQSSCTPRSKDSLLKLWDKFKTTAKLKASVMNVSGTGKRLSSRPPDPLMEQVTDMLGIGGMGFFIVNNKDSAVDDEPQMSPSEPPSPTSSSVSDVPVPIPLKTEEVETNVVEDPIAEVYEDSAPEFCNVDVEEQHGTATPPKNIRVDMEHPTEPAPVKARLWGRLKRRPQLTSKNERSEVIASYKDVNAKKLNYEDLRFQLLKEEAAFKRELFKRQLEVAAYDIEIRRRALAKINEGEISLNGFCGLPPQDNTQSKGNRL